jgi:hypothetical protein
VVQKAHEVQKKQAQHKRIHNPTAWREDMAQKLNNLLETAGLYNNAALNDDDGTTSSQIVISCFRILAMKSRATEEVRKQ